MLELRLFWYLRLCLFRAWLSERAAFWLLRKNLAASFRLTLRAKQALAKLALHNPAISEKLRQVALDNLTLSQLRAISKDLGPSGALRRPRLTAGSDVGERHVPSPRT
jgi:hypothetical protein